MPALVDAIMTLVAEGLHTLSPEEQRAAVTAAIAAARTALGADPLAGMAGEDAARHARILAEHAASITRVSAADVSVARRLLVSPAVTGEEAAALGRLASHASITLGDAL